MRNVEIQNEYPPTESELRNRVFVKTSTTTQRDLVSHADLRAETLPLNAPVNLESIAMEKLRRKGVLEFNPDSIFSS